MLGRQLRQLVATFVAVVGIATIVRSPSALSAQERANGLAYEVAGTGPPVVFIHGSNLDRRQWRNEAALLRDRAMVVRYDLRAHGQSDFPTEAFSPVTDLAAVLDALTIERAILVGLSAGSRIALDFALAHPDRVRALVLAAPGISGYVPEELPEFFTPLIAALQAGNIEEANELLLQAPITQVPDSVRPLVEQMVRDNARLWSVPQDLMLQPEAPAIERLHELTIPVLVLVGGRDLDAVKDQARLIGEHAPAAQVVRIARGGHLLNLTSPAEFHRLLLEFLETLASAP